MHQMKPILKRYLNPSWLTRWITCMDPPTIDHPLPQTKLEELVGETITAKGLGVEPGIVCRHAGTRLYLRRPPALPGVRPHRAF